MKMLFLLSEGPKVERVSRALTGAGIACEIRQGVFEKGPPRDSALAQLWIENDHDCHRALLVCVRLGVGFSGKPAITVEVKTDNESQGRK